tara:strand:+ start:1694 stop:2140 length:447 start_codon:yes stop_codon:yes gene_type:complete
MPGPLVVYTGGAAGGGMVKLLSHGIKSFMPKVMAGLSSPVVQAVGIAEVIDNFQDMFGNPDDPVVQQGLEEVAKTVGHILNDENILWPTDPRTGEAIVPRYLTFDINQGRAWFSKQHYSKKTVDAAFRRGQARGRRSRNTRVRGTTSV